MSCTEVIRARVTPETKRAIAEAAAREMLSESAWLKRLLLRDMQAARDPATMQAVPRHVEGAGRHGEHRGNPCERRILIRLRPEDRLLLDARSEARGMRPATYVAVLTRSHLRRLAPLPKDEMLALRRSIGELAAIGRNINQIAKVANDGGRLPGSARDEFRAMLKVCEALRDNTKALLKANVTSWESGVGQDL
jgi:uncharacterized protein (DUF1778 family)